MGKYWFDYELNRTRLDQNEGFGLTYTYLQLFSANVQYVYVTSGGTTRCSACFLKPPLYPMTLGPRHNVSRTFEAGCRAHGWLQHSR